MRAIICTCKIFYVHTVVMWPLVGSWVFNTEYRVYSKRMLTHSQTMSFAHAWALPTWNTQSKWWRSTFYNRCVQPSSLHQSPSSRPACKSVSMLVRHWRISWAVPCLVAAWYALLRTCLIISYLLGVHFVCTVWMWAAGLRKKEYCSPDFMQLPTSIASAAKPLSAGNMWVAYLTSKYF